MQVGSVTRKVTAARHADAPSAELAVLLLRIALSVCGAGLTISLGSILYKITIL
jgi:hypothetical protein